MVEYRQRLRVMLSSSQGKYQLQKSSGSISKEINYIYYFTYFHPYSTHPFWDEFKEVIQEKIDGFVCTLKWNICWLWSSHCSLSVAVFASYCNTKKLIESIETIEALVKTSICRLKQYIQTQIKRNKEKIQETIKEIETKINVIGTNLKCYINNELKDIESKFKENVENIFNNFYEQLKCHIGFIKDLEKTICQRSICEINECIDQINKFYSFIISSVKGIGFNCKFEISFEKICLGKIRRNLTTINKDLPAFKRLVEELEESKIDVIVRDITVKLSYNNLGSDVNENLKHFNDYIKKLEAKKKEIEQKKEAITKAFKPIEEELEKLYKVKLILQRLIESGNSFLFCDLKCLIQTTIAKIEELNAKKNKIEALLKKAGEQLSKLDQGIKNVKEELLRLKEIKDLNEELQKYSNQSQNSTKELQKIKEYTESLKYDESLFHINNRNKEFNYVHYYDIVYPVRKTVLKLLCNNDIKYAYSHNSKHYLQNVEKELKIARVELKAINTQLDNLGKSGTRIYYLSKIIYSLKLLEEIQKVLQEVKLQEVKPDSTYYKLKSDLQILKPLVQTVLCIDTRIEGINANKPNSQTLNNLHNNLRILSLNAQSIEQLNEGLKAIENPEITKDGNVMFKKLEEFKVKLCCITPRLTKVIQHLGDYLEEYLPINEREIKTKTVQDVKRDLENIKKIEVVQIPAYIEEIKKAPTTIPKLYSTYICNFTAFKKALSNLETCLDYFIGNFLTCSLCTTTYYL